MKEARKQAKIPPRKCSGTQATPSAPLQATENTDQQSPLDDDGDEIEPQATFSQLLNKHTN
jgi:hypothetical protein